MSVLRSWSVRTRFAGALALLGVVLGFGFSTRTGRPAGDAAAGALRSGVDSLDASPVFGLDGKLGAAVSGNEPTHSWVVDGAVYAIAVRRTDVVVGGSFSLIGRTTGSWAAIGPSGQVA